MEITVEDIPQNQQGPITATPHQPPDPLSHRVLSERFNIDTPTKEEDGKLQEIYRHAFDLSETKDTRDILMQVIHLEQVLGSPRLGESRLDRLYRYAKLRRQQRQIEEEIQDVSIGSHL